MRLQGLLAVFYGEGGDCSLSNPDIAPSSCAMACTEPSIRSTAVESARISSRMLRMSVERVLGGDRGGTGKKNAYHGSSYELGRGILF
jgi:hypothetical protein